MKFAAQGAVIRVLDVNEPTATATCQRGRPCSFLMAEGEKRSALEQLVLKVEIVDLLPNTKRRCLAADEQ
jgi:hypothetical protein